MTASDSPVPADALATPAPAFKPSLGFTAMLAATTAVIPLSVDAYLPAFPGMAVYFNEPITAISRTVGIYMCGIAVGQLLGGYLSDRFRRKHVLLVGLAIFLMSSAAIALQRDLLWVYVLRFIQALGGGSAIVCVPAIVRDRVSGKEAAKLFGLIGMITICAPAVAPSFGSVILEFADWRAIFAFLTLYAGFVMVLISRGLKPAKVHLPVTGPLGLAASFALVLRNPLAMRFVGIQALAFSVILIFVTNAPLLYQDHFGASERLFGLLFGANIVVMMGAMFASRHLVEHHAPTVILRVALTCQTVATALLVLSFVAWPHLPLIVPCIMVAIGSVGASSPNVQASFLEFFPHNSGVAASIMGALQFLSAGLISAASTKVAEYGLLPLFGLMLACAIGALALAWPTPHLMGKWFATRV